MIAATFVPLMLLTPAPPVPEWNCENPQVQQEMNWCAAREFDIEDALLNAQWKESVDAMKARDDAFAASDLGAYDAREGYSESLLEAQRGWLRYRDAHCRVDGYTARGGSMEPMLVSSCMAQLTRQRTDELRALIATE